MDYLRVHREIVKLIGKVGEGFTKQITYFEEKLKVIEFQPLEEGKGPSQDFINKFMFALTKALVTKGFWDKLLIVVITEKGPEVDDFDLMENNIYKIRIVIL